MTDYRIYLLDSRGRFARATHCEAATDGDALAAAAAFNNTYGFEVWQGGRKVSGSGTFTPRNLVGKPS